MTENYESVVALKAMERHLGRIANLLEGFEMRERQRNADVDPDSLGALALWREEVSHGGCLLGFADWRAWHEADKPKPGGPSPEDVEAAAQAVTRGFADMEAQVKGERDG